MLLIPLLVATAAGTAAAAASPPAAAPTTPAAAAHIVHSFDVQSAVASASGGFSFEEQAVVFALQGIVNGKGDPYPSLYVEAGNLELWPGEDGWWRAQLERRRNGTLIFDDVTPPTLCSLLGVFAGKIAGRVSYSGDDGFSLPIALTVSGLERALPVSPTVAERHGCLADLPLVRDLRPTVTPQLRDRTTAWEWAIQTLLPNCSKTVAFNLNHFRLPVASSATGTSTTDSSSSTTNISTSTSTISTSNSHSTAVTAAATPPPAPQLPPPPPPPNPNRPCGGRCDNTAVTLSDVDFAVQQQAFIMDFAASSHPADAFSYDSDAQFIDRVFEHMMPGFAAFGWHSNEFKWVNQTGVGGGSACASLSTGSLSFWSRLPCENGGPSRAKSASRSVRRALLTSQIKAGSRYRCGKRT